jgi:hypothetical protein
MQTCNPFLIDIEDKEEYSFDEYKEIQQKLSEKNIDDLLNNYYPPKNDFYKYADFKNRCTNGLRQNMIDITTNQLPTKTLYQIGTGGNHQNCIICCTSFSHENTDFKTQTDTSSRYNASKNILTSLKEVGFNGHLYLMNGGFPNPTGTEMKYAGVPYCFKIFMMLEAKKIGFKNVLWIDSNCYAINNPQRLFDLLDENPILFQTVSYNNNYDAMIFQPTIQLLNSITNNNIYNATYLMTIVFGLNLHSSIITKIIDEYYDMVKLGLPFLSIFPEEIVLTSIINKPEYQYLIQCIYENTKLQIHESKLDINSAKKDGFFFLHRYYQYQNN